MEQVIQNFIDELNSRIDVLNSMDNRLDSSKVDQINNIINKYGNINSEEYTKEDLDIILDIIGIKNDKYDEIDQIIKDYIDSYNTVKETNNSFNNESVNKYNKYISILTSDSINTEDINYDELDELMTEASIPVPDKWKILSYIDKKCIEFNENKILAYNLNSKLFLYNKLYLNNQDFKEYVNNSINNMSIDIDMIPSLAKKIAGDSYDIDKTRNALSTIILNELYRELNETDDKEQLDNLQEMVNNCLQYIDDYEDKVVNPIKNIILDYDDILTEEINKGNDINTYMNISIDDIEKLVSDHDKAVILKKLPLIKSMKDTMNSLDECDKSSEEYLNYLNLLNDLKEAYQGIK